MSLAPKITFVAPGSRHRRVVVVFADKDLRLGPQANALKAGKLIERAPACDKIIADGKRMFAALTLRYEQFISVDRAEEHHASVAAASVMAVSAEPAAARISRHQTRTSAVVGIVSIHDCSLPSSARDARLRTAWR